MVADRIVDWSKTRWGRAGIIGMAAFNIATLVAIVLFAMDAREHRRAETARYEAQELIKYEWLARPIMAPTELQVTLGAGIHDTNVVEAPIHEGSPRVLSPEVEPGVWYTELWRGTEMVCRMPVHGGNPADYRPDAARTLDMNWAKYTSDDGSCFASIRPCHTHTLRALRKMTKYGVTRYLDPVVGLFDVPCDWSPR